MNEERLHTVLIRPHISEKATILSDRNRQFAFRVAPDASKREIKAAVEKMFKVSVTGVTVMNVKGKTRRTRYGMGRKSNWRKAYVSLAEGHDIDFSTTE